MTTQLAYKQTVNKIVANLPFIFGTVSIVSRIARLFMSYMYAFSCRTTISLHKSEYTNNKYLKIDQLFFYVDRSSMSTKHIPLSMENVDYPSRITAIIG